MYRVVIGGHSQTPTSLPQIDNVIVTLNQIPGAKISAFWTDERFRDIRSVKHNLAVLFLGGNDLSNNSSPRAITDALLSIVSHLTSLHDKVVVVLIEHRELPDNNRHGITNLSYRQQRRRVNNNLARPLQRMNVRTLHFSDTFFAKLHTRDGVHFGSQARRGITNAFVSCITRHRDTFLSEQQ